MTTDESPGDRTAGDDSAPERAAAPPPARPARRRGRTWPQRLVLAMNIVLVIGCLVAAVALFVSQKNLEDVQRVDALPTPDELAPAPSLVVETLLDNEPTPSNGQPTTTSMAAAETTTAATGASTTAESTIFIPPGAVNAENFLITGSDSRECIDPNSPYAAAFLAGAGGVGERPDTIMMLRLEPETGRAAILSFPRDLWVPLAGTNRRSKINAAFDKTDPSTLIATIESFFGIHVDHYINLDFCVFKDLVDAVGGVSVPFLTPVRDRNTGLQVDTAGCFTFSGEHALAYVRSRKIQYQDERGRWRSEGTADIGRIRRQQDFLRRVMQKVRSKGVFDIGFLKELLDAFQRRVQVDLDLTADDLLRLANAMRHFDPETTRSFIVEGKFGYKGSAAVIDPILTSDRMKKVLSMFQGKASISEAPPEQEEPLASLPPITSAPSTASSGAPSAAPASTLPDVSVEDNSDSAYGATAAVVPDKNTSC
jgi:LCP family protein required for cell wall assembly